MSSTKNITNDIYLKWCEKYKNGMTLREIGKEFGVSDVTVSYHFKKNGFKTRTSSECQMEDLEFHNKDLNEIQKQVLIGSLIGDGTIRSNKETCFLQIGHSLNQKEWLEYKCSILGEMSSKKGVYERKTNGFKGKTCLEFRTKPNVNISKYRDEVYTKEGKKLNKIIKELDVLGLAILWGDDGSYGKVSNKYEYGILSLCDFDKEENEIFAQMLRDKFFVECSVLKKKSYDKMFTQIRISKKGMETLRNLIGDILPNKMKYKVGL